jgi:NADPH2:quinone reductase
MTDDPGLPQPPYVPGGEIAGTVREIGEGVEGFVSASL